MRREMHVQCMFSRMRFDRCENALLHGGVCALEHASTGGRRSDALVRSEPKIDDGARNALVNLVRVLRENPNTSAHFAVSAVSAFDEDAVAAHDPRIELHAKPTLAACFSDLDKFAEEQSAVVAASPFDESLVIDSCEKTRARAAREGLHRVATKLFAWGEALV